VAASALLGGVVAAGTAGIGRAVGGAKNPGSDGTGALSAPTTGGNGTTTTTSTVPGAAPTAPTAPSGSGKAIGRASQVPIGGAATFQDPASGDPGLVIQPAKDTFVAFNAICPHAGCTVGYSQGAKLIVCPCHGSEFDPSTGAVVSPPASRGLTPIHVTVDSGGELVVDS
jgi:thiosulfate dehydrogenase [quinone] large subunit